MLAILFAVSLTEQPRTWGIRHVSSTSAKSKARKRARLIEAHLPLVRSVARRYLGRGETLDDLVQVGSIGLIKSSDRFDPSRGVAFATFASPAIEGEIRRHLADRTSSIRIPRDLQRMSGELPLRRAELTATLGRSPTVHELADALGGNAVEVERLLRAKRARKPIPMAPTAGDTARAPASEPSSNSDDRLLLAGSVRSLGERERRIVLLRFHGDMTERQIGRELGISQAHVSRLLAGALAKLRANLAATGDSGARGISPSRVISRSSQAEPERPHRQHGPNVLRGTGGETRIAGVTGQPKHQTLERYLELPYHVAVRSKREGKRSWWTASVEELPGCGAQGNTSDEAVRLLRPAMEAWLSAALAERREIPVPSGSAPKPRESSSYSGRFLVRMPSGLHQQLARAAEHEDISLNRFVIDALARAVTSTPVAGEEEQGVGQDLSSPAAEPTVAAGGLETAPHSGPAAIDQLPSARQPVRTLQVALATNLIVVVVAGVIAVALLVLALQRGL